MTESSEQVAYGFQQASLTDVFSELQVAFSGELTRKDLGDTFVTNDPEVEIAWVDGSSASSRRSADGDDHVRAVTGSTNTLQIKYKKLGFQAGPGIEVDGTSSFVLNPDFFLELKPGPAQALPTLELGATISPNLTTSVSIASLYGGQVSYTVDKSWQLPAFKRTIVVPVFGVPVAVPFWIRPVVGISGAVNGTAGSKFTTTHGYAVTGELGFHKTVAAGAQGLASASSNSSVNVTDVESEFGVNLTAPKVEIQFLIYSVAGPNFDMGVEAGVVGKSTVSGTPPVEGVGVEAAGKFIVNGGLKSALEFKNINAVKALLGDVSVEYSPFSLKLYEKNVVKGDPWFFPYRGAASVVVRDNGLAPDDIFEVSIDGTVIGRTTKGGSGQFRLKNLRPGVRSLTLKTIEDDSPPGTYEISLNDGLTFSAGGAVTSGGLELGATRQFDIVVPQPATAP